MVYTDTAYDAAFYRNHQQGAATSARVIVPIILSRFPLNSVVDLGCGDGTWLKEFAANGIKEYLGIDGPYVSPETLRIPRDHFQEADLTALTSVGRRFDLACSLEVAEHLSRECASDFVGLLTQSAPIVLFSAAIPGQGGNHHINEQWQSYWCDLFRTRGFQPFDCIRPLIYGNPAVEWWYRQNTIVYCDDTHAPRDIKSLATRFELDRIDPALINNMRNQIARLDPHDSLRDATVGIKRCSVAIVMGLKRRIKVF